ncbi:kinase-like domain-containing protein [Xylaria scruposa]|nr:kinase-like domain-containing protein [Xylaria scruposa]
MQPVQPFIVDRCEQLEIGGIQVDLLDDERLEDKIGDILRDHYCGNCGDALSFLPRCELEDVLSYNVIRHVLRQTLGCALEESNQTARQILGNRQDVSYVQILTILLLISKVKYIQYFLRENICDRELPLVDYKKLHKRLSGPGFCKMVHIFAFCQRQWEVVVPVFNFSERTTLIKKFQPQIRLPFEYCKDTSQGGQGRILQVKIHQGHLIGYSSDNLCFAVKRFERTHTGRRMWEDELTVLKRFSGPTTGHKHLIKLLLAYEQEHEGYFLVFPLAEGDMANHWRRHRFHSPSPEDARWVFEQCSGIAGALATLHGHNFKSGHDLGRHGDIKPENILWFKRYPADRGYLVVADFTLSRFHSAKTVNVTLPGKRGFTPTYRPPEVDLKSRLLSAQSYDIWSLGCVYLEFLTWYLLGYDATRGQGCQSFVNERIVGDNQQQDKFFNIVNDNGVVPRSAEVKESVKKWIFLLHGASRCSEAIHDFLDLIEKYMIVINPEKRGTMDQVERELGEIVKRCSEAGYCHSGTPRSSPNKESYSQKPNEKPATQFDTYSTAEYTNSPASDDGSNRIRQPEEVFKNKSATFDKILERYQSLCRGIGNALSSILPSRYLRDSNDQHIPASTKYSQGDMGVIELEGIGDPVNSVESAQVENNSVGLEVLSRIIRLILGPFFDIVCSVVHQADLSQTAVYIITGGDCDGVDVNN